MGGRSAECLEMKHRVRIVEPGRREIATGATFDGRKTVLTCAEVCFSFGL
jgi:hypothetical protein